MDSLEKFLNDLYIESLNKNFNKDSIENPDIKVDFLKILKSSIQERKKIWQSIENNIDEDEKFLKKFLDLKETADETKDDISNELGLLNTTFTKLEIKNVLESCDQNVLNLDTNSFCLEEVTTPIKPKEKIKNSFNIPPIEE